jgi:hypothetical protein
VKLRFYSCAAYVALVAVLGGCGGSSSSTSSSQPVTISPTSATVTISGTQQFTATVQATDTNVTWQINGTTGGDATHGTISGTGLYTAPAVVPSTPVVTVTAISVANANFTADASVSIALPIAVTPSTVSVQAGQTRQFSAAVSFSTNTAVTWQVNGTEGGNSTVGTIDTNGLYTAPNALPAQNPVTVTAVAKADTSKTASSTVTVTPPPIVISPTTAVVSAGAQQAFTASVLTNAVTPEWSVTCASTVTGACGSIDSSGKYTAPAAPPPRGKVTIQASKSDQSASTASVTATIQFGKPSLAGQYVFSLQDDIGHAVPSQAGILVLDGAGNISGGLLDSADKPGAPELVTGGTYEVGVDGRGTATVQTATGSIALQLVVSGHAQAFLVRTDSGANQAAGTLDLQQNLPAGSALNGSYALSVFGVSLSTPVAGFAEAGSITADSSGNISGGTLDQNNGSVLPTENVTAGSFTQPSSAGRGALTISTSSGTQTFAYYPIDSTRAKLVGADGTLDVVGELFTQPQGPFSKDSLKGRYAFSVAGNKSGTPFGVAGVFTLDGAGNLSDQQFDGLPQTIFDFNPGAFAVTDSTTGRSTASWTFNGGSKVQYVLYPRSDGGFVMLESDGIYLGSGVSRPQTDATIANFLTVQGSFAFGLGGSTVAAPSTGERFTGQAGPSTSSALTGRVDGTGISQGAVFTLNLLSLNTARQRYLLGISSESEAFASGSLVLYRINDNQAFGVQSNTTGIRTGLFQRQY